MIVKHYQGIELVKERSNSPEEFFNLSQVTYEEKQVLKTFSVLYLRYFEEKLIEEKPDFQKSIIEDFSEKGTFKDLFALTILANNGKFTTRKRLYINDYDEFLAYVTEMNLKEVKMLLNHKV
ncbi:hypothetical protein [Metabacillus arenae]|uniref:Uncharacterized protein n=1 Tax=Metabacillus arenae TaxID=2771434 RepID=A0A926NES5_9BACI|nr:hypothetical protein [Metabacillus arenae]MBD1378668.1 hypothetical protein [Metabacillus arenae]